MIHALALEVFVLCLGIFLLMMEAFSPRLGKITLGWTAVVGLLVAFVGSFFLGPVPEGFVASGFYVGDPAALFFKRLMLLSTALTILAAIEYAPVYERYVPASTPGAGLGEFLILPVFACAGLMWMSSAADLILVFVSLELATITFYVLVASMRKNRSSLEAGVKYLILGALSTGFLVYGITWIFGMTGQTSLDAVAAMLQRVPAESRMAVLFGFGLVVVALGFKVAAVPFQFWVPDVYQGAPTPVTAFLSVASKAAGFLVLMRVVEAFTAAPALRGKVELVMTVLAAATLLYGNLAAMPQTNLKRLLAYSSIAHAGYLLMAVAAVGSGQSGPAIGFYLAGYLVMTFAAFLVVIVVARQTGSDDLSDFNGLGSRAPGLALALLLAVLSLAGLPFTVGFIGKFLVFEAALRAGLIPLAIIGAFTVACGFYYYFKVVRALYWQAAAEGAPSISSPAPIRVALLLLSAATIFFGIFPQPILALLR
jgi:NADH-quinone oxidoreductase subunit N